MKLCLLSFINFICCLRHLLYGISIQMNVHVMSATFSVINMLHFRITIRFNKLEIIFLFRLFVACTMWKSATHHIFFCSCSRCEGIGNMPDVCLQCARWFFCCIGSLFLGTVRVCSVLPAGLQCPSISHNSFLPEYKRFVSSMCSVRWNTPPLHYDCQKMFHSFHILSIAFLISSLPFLLQPDYKRHKNAQ